MSNVTLPDIQLSEYTLENLPLLKELRGKLLNEKPRVCIERARWVTRYLTKHQSSQDSKGLQYAKAVSFYLENKEPCFFDDNLLAGSTSTKPFGAPVYPEFTGITVWPELDTMSEREKNPQILSREDANELNRDVFPFWMDNSILEYTRAKYNNPDCMRLFERIVFFIAGKAGCVSHTVPDYKVVLNKGIEYIITQAERMEKEANDTPESSAAIEFYQAVQITMKSILVYAEKLKKKAAACAEKEQDRDRKKKYLAMAEALNQVPAKPARNLHEAINALWIAHIAIHAENINMAMSPGRLDQILYGFYKDDIEKERITVKEAIELVGCLWLKLNDNTNLVPETAEELFGGAGTVPAVTVGGVDADENDAVNDLTYIMLRVTELLKTRDPSLNARYHYEKNSAEYRKRVAEVIASTKAVPAFLNDVVNIGVLENQGTTPAHARDYAVVGCVELASAGRSYDASSSIMMNLVSILELTLHNGKRPVTGDEQIGPVSGDPSAFTSYDEFWEAFTKQAEWLIGQAIELNELLGAVHQKTHPSPLLSAFFEGPMDAGKDLIYGGALYNSSGATHIGFADTVDSLNAIEKAVFIDKKCTFSELLGALKNDFTGNEKLHAYLVNKAPKYGTDDPIAVKNAQTLIRFLSGFYQGHTNYRGGRYRPGYWTMTNHAGQGKLAGALPNGRKAYKVFASGITPVSQAAGDLTACIRSVGSLDNLCISSGEAFNLKYPVISGEKDLKRFGQIIEAYCKYGGEHIQFNIMSYEDLLDAKKNPEKYPDLLVRVSGYSAYFKDLNEAMKDEIITRTAYNLENGSAVPFPESQASLQSFK